MAMAQAEQLLGRPQSMIKESAPEADLRYDSLFHKMYEKHYPRVFAFIYNRVSNVDLAKDLAAETFERAYVNGRNVREAVAYKSWLFVIAKNTVAGHYRKQSRETSRMEKAGEEISLREPPMSLDDQAIHGERMSKLRDLVRSLSERDQELLSLRFDADLSIAEIAQIVGMSEVNVRVGLFRSRKRLRTLIEKSEVAA